MEVCDKCGSTIQKDTKKEKFSYTLFGRVFCVSCYNKIKEFALLKEGQAPKSGLRKAGEAFYKFATT